MLQGEIKMKTAPCKDCERKGCGPYHDKCEVYQAWKKDLDERNESKRMQRIAESILISPKRRR